MTTPTSHDDGILRGKLEATTAALVKDQTVCIGLPHTGASNVVLVLDGWSGKRARITVEEIVDKQDSGAADVSGYRPCSREFAEAHPGESEWRCLTKNVKPSRFASCADNPPGNHPALDYEFRTRAPYAPGDAIPWQEAQRRVDAGLAVECSLGGVNWHPVNQRNHSCGDPYRYRIPPAIPAELAHADEPGEVKAEMTAGEATAYLRGGKDWLRAVADESGYIWVYGDGQVAVGNGFCGESINIPSTYTPLLPATRTQVELESKLRAMTGSRDAAVAALEKERSKNKKLERDLRRCFDALRGVKSEANTACGYVEGIVEEIKGKAEG